MKIPFKMLAAIATAALSLSGCASNVQVPADPSGILAETNESTEILSDSENDTADNSIEKSTADTGMTTGREPAGTGTPETENPDAGSEKESDGTADQGTSDAEAISDITAEDVENAYVDESDATPISNQELAAMSSPPAPAIPTILTPVASGTHVEQNGEAIIDYSNRADGYVMVQYTAATNNRLKVQVKGPRTTYTYDLPAGSWTTFPLSDGNGDYQTVVYRNVVDTKYAIVLSTSFSVSLHDEFAPYLRPNQYVNFSAGSKVVTKASELSAGIEDPLEKVEKVYDWVVGTLSYDHNKAATVTSGYLPVLDQVMKSKKGICFDYAALMTAMLRSQNVPCKLIVGYAGSTYHSWISVWTDESGWVDGAIFFDGSTWKRMDPTFASSGSQSAEIMDYIGKDNNYTAQYQY